MRWNQNRTPIHDHIPTRCPPASENTAETQANCSGLCALNTFEKPKTHGWTSDNQQSDVNRLNGQRGLRVLRAFRFLCAEGQQPRTQIESQELEVALGSLVEEG